MSGAAPPAWVREAEMARRDEGEMAPTSEIHGRSMRDPCEIHVSTCSTPPAAAALALHRAGRRERDGLQSWRAEMLERISRLAVASHISQRAIQHRCMGRDTASTVCFTLKSYFYFTVRETREWTLLTLPPRRNFLRGGAELPARSRTRTPCGCAIQRRLFRAQSILIQINQPFCSKNRPKKAL